MPRTKCRLYKNGKLRLCGDMMEATVLGVPLRVLEFVNRKTFKRSRLAVVLFAGKFRREGIELSVCPWCAESLQKKEG